MRNQILEKTNGGLDVIIAYYPQAREFVGTKKTFKIRDERTPSASIFCKNGEWFITDFGGDGRAKSCFDVVIENENFHEKAFARACNFIRDKFALNVGTLKKETNKPTISNRPATETDPEFSYKIKEATEKELALFSCTKEIFQKFKYFSVESYEIKKDGKIYTIAANENYPIFLHDCGDFQKFYKPLAFEKKDRFFYKGTKSANFINGEAEALAKIEELKQTAEKLFEEPKLDEIFICSGERDALSLANLGFSPVWFNSETAQISDEIFRRLEKIAEKIYLIPDLDETGARVARELSLKFWNLQIVELPAWIKKYRDFRGNSRKDLRDYLELEPRKEEFLKLKNSAERCKFWDDKTGEIQKLPLLFLLKNLGFAKIKLANNEFEFVKIENFKVKKFSAVEIRNFLISYFKEKNLPRFIIEKFVSSRKINATFFDDLETVEIDFSASNKEAQKFFFQNKIVKISKDEIAETAEKSFVWENEILPLNFKKAEPAFEVEGENLKIFHLESNLFKFCINSSRIYWRKELELLGQKDFLPAQRFKIKFPQLTEEQNREQEQILLNKIFAIGYLLHQYKEKHRALALWCMENKITEENEASGGSGKSFFIESLQKLGLLNTCMIDGRNAKVTDNSHIIDRVTEQTKLLFIDDARRHFDFSFFYSMITGNMVINPKNKSSFELNFENSPKIAITSNFPPPVKDNSTFRRLLIVLFSDYYHHNISGEYNETRQIYDDFGKNLFDVNYTDEERLADINFCFDCLRYYLQKKEKNEVCTAPFESVIQRINISIMGDLFNDWAQGYFSKEGDNLDCCVLKSEAFDDFLVSTKASSQQWKINRFSKALKAFAENSPEIEAFNPETVKGFDKKTKRILRRESFGKVREYFYLQSKGKKVNEEF